MIFEDLHTLNEIISLIRMEPQGSSTLPTSRFRDYHDPEVDRLFNTSPPISEQALTLDLESPLLDAQLYDAQNAGEDQEELPKNNKLVTFQKNPIVSVTQAKEELFRAVEVPSISREAATRPSGLSLLLDPKLQVTSSSTVQGPSSSLAVPKSGKIPLTIYLPNRSPLQILVSATHSVEDVIKIALATHKRNGVQPALHYHASEYYALRLHEGDGEPDEDFPALDRSRLLKYFGNLSEYCLCVAEGAIQPPPVPAETNASSMAFKPSLISIDGNSPNSTPVPVNMVLVLMPNAGHVKLRIDANTTAMDLLPMIAKKHRLRLFTEEYTFVLSQEDQARLQLPTPHLDPNASIMKTGIREFELQKRVYADSVKKSRQPIAMQHKEDERPHPETILYTDVTAAVYQEWNVIKKNKFGRMQARIIGIDGHKVYNSKRDTHSRNTSAVHRAQRDISTIRKVDFVDINNRTFKITFIDEREIYDIEYTCDTARDCAEIVAKLNYLLSKRNEN